LYVASYRRILGTLITLLGDVAAAEDCTQEAFERAYRGWKAWRPDAPAEAWLHRIAINVAISDRRHQKLRQAGEIVRRLGRSDPTSSAGYGPSLSSSPPPLSCGTTTATATERLRPRLASRSGPSRHDWPPRGNSSP
jgi:DNA-directed RNA polymerase specialized sigma24 family protein